MALGEEECPTQVVSLNLPWLSKELVTVGDELLLACACVMSLELLPVGAPFSKLDVGVGRLELPLT